MNPTLAVLAIVNAATTLIAVTVDHLAPGDATNWMLLSIMFAILATGR